MTKKLNPNPELEELIRDLNETAQTMPAGDETEPPATSVVRQALRWQIPEASSEGNAWAQRLLQTAVGANATDVLLVADQVPFARINGHLEPLGEKTLSVSATEALCAALVPESHRELLGRAGAVDFALALPGAGRLRCNVHRERGRWSAAIRLLPGDVPELSTLNLPAQLERFADLEHGLVLVTGPTGSGKSTTLAAIVRSILARRSVHLVTIEDPVEYTHPHGDGVIEHVEIGRDADNFAGALRAALRQDPDVLLVGEMRDAESISIAITAAETGHLVLSTLHTGDGPQTINRILDSYPAAQMETVRVQLSISLAAIISQQLLPRKDGKGRVPAVEILMATDAVRNLVRQGKVANLRSQLVLERASGMLALDRSLATLVADDLVESKEARPRARIIDEFDQLVRSMRRSPRS